MITLDAAPEVLCKKLSRDIFFGLINREFGSSFKKVSPEFGKWNRKRIETELLGVTNGRWVCEFMSIDKYVHPVLTGDAKLYEYKHALPVDGSWSQAFMTLRLHQQQRQNQYALELVGFFR